ncbi:MAG: YceI family protein [Candidatus Dormibacteraeota bacterium]|nr:YceI family protein [Candidatus Dormibacteraeota bacterium]
MSVATAPTTPTIPNYVAGRWAIDPVHSDVSFVIRHMMVSKVRGRFGTFSGEIVTADDPLDTSINASVDVTSISTNNDGRDAHLRSADFFDTEQYPSASFRSTGVRVNDGDLLLDGELTVKGVAKPVELALEVNGVGPDGQGGTRAGFSGRTIIDRTGFGIGASAVANSVVVLSDRVDLAVEIEAILQPQA